jgi:hypothetical protein
VVAVALAGCGFQHGALGSSQGDDAQLGDDAKPDDARALDTLLDGTPIANVCGGKIWLADFTNDPTAEDLNGDGTSDWAIRNGGTLDTNQLFGGVWHIPSAGSPLDTQPKQDFNTRTIVDVRMRNTTTSGAKGAVFWINVGFVAGSFAPLFVDVKLQTNSSQTAYVMTKNASSNEVVSGTVSGLSTGFVNVHLDILPATLEATYAISDGGGSSSSVINLVRPTATADDRWATVIAFSGASEFDRVQVEVCP